MIDPDEQIYESSQFGCKLVGMIPVSDVFGVDLIVTDYLEALKKREEENEKVDQYDFDNAGSVL